MKHLTMEEPLISNQQTIKEQNIKCIFNYIRTEPGISRAQLARKTTLSATTVSTLVDELVRDALVQETGPAVTRGAGRKPITLKLNPQGRQIALFSLSSWGIHFGLYDLSLKEIDSKFLPHSTASYTGFAQGVEANDPDAGADYMSFIESLLTNSPYYCPAKLLVIGITYPGIYLEREQAFTSTAMQVSISASSVIQFEKRLSVPVFLGNSSMCRAYAEKKHLDSPKNSISDLIYMNACDGLGAGIIAGGVFLKGQENNAGEVGHISINYQGKRCACGLRGCVEQYVNINAVTKRVSLALKEQSDGSAEEALTLEAIGRLCEEGNIIVRSVIDDVADMLFTAIYSTVCITGVKRVVIGGGIERLGDYFLKKLRSISNEMPRDTLARGIDISYARSGCNGDSIGIAQFYLDNVFDITAQKDFA